MVTVEKHRVEAIRWCDHMGGMIPILEDVAVGLINMGKALPTKIAPAMVALRKAGDDLDTFQLHIDDNHFDKFTSEEKAGVLFHELNHILFKHLAVRVSDTMSNQRLITMAQEIQCNDTVLHYGIKLPYMHPNDPNDGIIYGEKILGKNCFGMSLQEIYDLLEDNEDNLPDNHQGCDEIHITITMDSSGQGDSTQDSGQGSGSQGSGDDENQDNQGSSGGGDGSSSDEGGEDSADGEGKSDCDTDGGSQCGSSNGSATISMDDLEDIIEQITNGMSEKGEEALREASGEGSQGGDNSSNSKTPGSSDGERSFTPTRKLNTSRNWKWRDILRNMSSNLNNALGGHSLGRTVDDWRFTPRTLSGVMGGGNLRLPTHTMETKGDEEGIKPTVLIAVDQSGSISTEVAERARQLALTIPQDKVEVRLCLFASGVVEMDITDGTVDEDNSVGWGTDFTPIHTFSREVFAGAERNTPHNVIVFTDGYGNFDDNTPTTTLDSPLNWHWVKIGSDSMEEFVEYLARAFHTVEDDLNVYDADLIDE